jgi:hypothetical protein
MPRAFRVELPRLVNELDAHCTCAAPRLLGQKAKLEAANEMLVQTGECPGPAVPEW